MFKAYIWPQDCKSRIRKSQRLPKSGWKNPPQGGFLMPTSRTPEQENQRNLQSPSGIEEMWISMCSGIQNQLHKSNPNIVIQTVVLWPPFKVGRPHSLPEDYHPVWVCEQITQESENGFDISRRKIMRLSLAAQMILFLKLKFK